MYGNIFRFAVFNTPSGMCDCKSTGLEWSKPTWEAERTETQFTVHAVASSKYEVSNNQIACSVFGGEIGLDAVEGNEFRNGANTKELKPVQHAEQILTFNQKLPMLQASAVVAV